MGSPRLENIKQLLLSSALSSSVQVQPSHPALSWIFPPSLLRWITNVVFVNYNYPAENPALFIVRDRSEDIQHGGVSPALVNLENKEISSVAIMMLPLIPCNKRKCQSSSLPSSERGIGNLTMIKYLLF